MNVASGPLAAVLERIGRTGPIPFDEYVEFALYHDDGGFFSATGGSGRTRDFLTSPEVGPLFGAVMARALDEWWHELGDPDPFVVVDAGAGVGTLARDIIAATPACGVALRYLLVERSARLRDEQELLLPLELPAFVLGPVARDADDMPAVVPRSGPLVAALGEMPAGRLTGVVMANELLDNLPFALIERTREGVQEVRVGREGGQLVEVLVPAPPDLVADVDRLVPSLGVGARIPVQRAAQRWLRDALGAVDRGRVVVIDYADSTPSLAAREWTQWVRTYRAHGPGGEPLDNPGGQDITCEVAVDQLARLARPTADRSQADFLRAHGIDELVADARAEWRARAHVGDLSSLAARSRVSEADALTDPTGLGAFRVLEWVH